MSTFQPHATELPTVAKALLNTIADTESPSYNTRFNGRKPATFSGYKKHPNVCVKVPWRKDGKCSTAAGQYQQLGYVWRAYRDKLGLKDFSPANQDRAAWAQAKVDYRDRTGGNLERDLNAGLFKKVEKGLAKTWTSLRGGDEQNTRVKSFEHRFKGHKTNLVGNGINPTESTSASGSIAATVRSGVSTLLDFGGDLGDAVVNVTTNPIGAAGEAVGFVGRTAGVGEWSGIISRVVVGALGAGLLFVGFSKM